MSVGNRRTMWKIISVYYSRPNKGRSMKSTRNIMDTIYLLYVVGKFVGSSCYSVSKNQKYKVSFESYNFLQFVSFLGLFLTLSYLNLYCELNNDVNNTRIFNQAQQIQMTLSLLCVIAGSFEILLMRQKFWNIAWAIYEIDIQVGEEKWYCCKCLITTYWRCAIMRWLDSNPPVKLN